MSLSADKNSGIVFFSFKTRLFDFCNSKQLENVAKTTKCDDNDDDDRLVVGNLQKKGLIFNRDFFYKII